MFPKQINAKNAFRKPTEKEVKDKADRLLKQQKRIEELKDAARKLVASPLFVEFKSEYLSLREVQIDIIKSIDPSMFNWEYQILQAQSVIVILDRLLGIEKMSDQ